MGNFIQLILEPLKEVYLEFIKFLPKLLAMLIVVLIGIFAARVVRAVLMKFMKAIKFDSWSDRMGLTGVMRKGDLWAKPSVALGSIVYWVLIIVAVMAGLSALRLQAIDNLVSSFVLYLPRALSAVVILVFGYIVAGFIARAVLIAGVNKGYHYAKIVAEAIRLLLIVLILAMAMEQLQVAPSIVLAAFSIIFGGIVLTLSIAFGVGAIETVKKIIEKETAAKKEETKDEIEHI